MSRTRYRSNGIWAPWGQWQDHRPLVKGVDGVPVAALQKNNSGLWLAADLRVTGYTLSSSSPPSLSNPLAALGAALGSTAGVFNEWMKVALPFNQLLQTMKPLSCTEAGTFARRRDAPGHSLNDTYARAVEIEKENKSKGIPDNTRPESLPAIPVCYSIDASGRCEPTGETVRVPGDLAVPLDWQALIRGGPFYCGNFNRAIEVVPKIAGRDDGRKRYIRCRDAFLLSLTRAKLMRGAIDETASPK